uniref:Sec-independent protein translocase component TatC n=2 Tax=Gracilaria tenuistipitata TaxID=2510778 RepID=A0A2S1PUQ9_GRATE|nr:SecY [Gracilaria tenuistipitata]ARU07664.1 SecY [Gracilaria tenuistipitata]AWH62562.1 SecY [Gracilaria tenuistipitata]AWH62587.1 SecY [Gracilaria tenuistipitata var. liui]AXI97764.1 Sec-independent protein translocase component TatC [Gracilaria tenuistipitata]
MSQKLIYLYSLEIFFRLFYVCLSFFFCMIIASLNIYYLIFFEVYPFVIFEIKKFIVTNVMDLFNIVWFLIISKSFFFIFPYWVFHIYKFCSTSWYKYQLKFLKKSFNIAFLFSLFCSNFFYFFLLPSILYLLTKWEIQNTNLFGIFIEFRIISYVKWVLTFRYLIGSFSFFICLILLHIWTLLTIDHIYFFIKHYRKVLLFILLCILFLLIPPDGFLQVFLIGFVFFLFEIVFLFICYKFCSIK